MSKENVKKAEVVVEETTEVKVDIQDTKTKVRNWFAKKGTQAIKFVKRNAIPFGVGVATGTVIAAKIMFTGATEEEFIDDALEEDVDVDLNDDVNDLVTVGDEEEDLED